MSQQYHLGSFPVRPGASAGFHRCLTWLPWGKSSGSPKGQYLGKFYKFSIQFPGKFSSNPCGQIPVELCENQVSPHWTLSSQGQFPDSASSIASFPKCLSTLLPPLSSLFPQCPSLQNTAYALSSIPATSEVPSTPLPPKQIHSKFLWHLRKWVSVHWMQPFGTPVGNFLHAISSSYLPTNLIPQTLQCQLWKIFAGE